MGSKGKKTPLALICYLFFSRISLRKDFAIELKCLMEDQSGIRRISVERDAEENNIILKTAKKSYGAKNYPITTPYI